MKKCAMVFVVAVSSAVCGCAHSQIPEDTPVSADKAGSSLKRHARLVGTIGDPEPDRPSEVGRIDADFYREALKAGVGDVALSEHAAHWAPSSEVRALAGTIARNHIDSNGRLSDASGLRWPRVRDEDRKALERMSKQSGRDYEIMYLRLMGERHSIAISFYETAWTQGASDRIREISEAMLPMLKAHAAMIDSLLEQRLRQR